MTRLVLAALVVAACGEPPPSARTRSASCRAPEAIEDPPPMTHGDKDTALFKYGAEKVAERDGLWVAVRASGRVREIGTYRAGLMTGVWRAWYENGQRRVEGSYEDGFRSGHFRWWYDDGHLMAEGDYAKDEPISSTWTYFCPDGCACPPEKIRELRIEAETLDACQDGKIEGTDPRCSGGPLLPLQHNRINY